MLYQLSYTPVGAIGLAGVPLVLGGGDGKAVVARTICYTRDRAQPYSPSAYPRSHRA